MLHFKSLFLRFIFMARWIFYCSYHETTGKRGHKKYNAVVGDKTENIWEKEVNPVEKKTGP